MACKLGAIRRAVGSAAVLVSLIAALAAGTRAAAQTVVTDGPAYAGAGSTPEAGATCTVSPPLSGSQGPSISRETITCSNVAQTGSIYFGLRNDQVVVGESMKGTGGPAAAANQFKNPVAGSGCPGSSCTITYTGTTTVNDSILGTSCGSSCTVTTQLVLTLTGVTGGDGKIVQVANQAPTLNGSNGDIGYLFQVSGTSFTVTVDVNAKYANSLSFGKSVFNVFNPAHANFSSLLFNQDISRVDLGFYWTPPPPVVTSIKTQGSNPTTACEVSFKVTFSEEVSGVDVTDFQLTSEIPGAVIESVIPGSPADTAIVTVCTGPLVSGVCPATCPSFAKGSLRLDLVDDDSIQYKHTVPLGGTGPGNGDFTMGDTYAIDHLAVKFGQDIIAFENQRSSLTPPITWECIDWGTTAIAPDDGRVLRIGLPTDTSGGGKTPTLLAADVGGFTINWHFKATPGCPTNFMASYTISADPVQEAMVVYFTDARMHSGAAPQVDLSPIFQAGKFVTIHYTAADPATQIPAGTTPPRCSGPGNQPAATDYLCIDGSNKLHALDKEGLALIEYDDTQMPSNVKGISHFLGVDIVQVKQDVSDVTVGNSDVGSRLLPSREPLDLSSTVQTRRAQVIRGLNQIPPLVYQHGIPSPEKDQVWAINPNDTPTNIDVVWMRPSATLQLAGLAVQWPFEQRQYITQWPTDPGKYQLYVRGPASALGPSVSIPAALNAQIVNQTAGQHPNLTGPTFTTDVPGFTLLKYATGNPAGSDWVGFEVVKSVLHDDAMFDPSAASVNVGTDILDPTHEGPAPGYVFSGNAYARAATEFAPAVYDGTGQIIPVNADMFEIWWSNLSRTIDPEGPSYPAWPSAAANRVQWPSKVKHYASQWPAGTDTIIIASQYGSGPLDATYPNWKLYVQGDSTKLGFNPNDEHAVVEPIATDAGTPSSGVFPLRDDLGVASQPFVLVQYPDSGAAQPLWPGAAPQKKLKFKLWNVVREQAPFLLKDWGTVRLCMGGDDNGQACSTAAAKSACETAHGACEIAPALLCLGGSINGQDCSFDATACMAGGGSCRENPYAGLVCATENGACLGHPIDAPFPLSQFVPSYAKANTAVSGPAFEDRKGRHWARAAGADGGPATIVMHYYYPTQPDFYFPPGATMPDVNGEVPWLDDDSKTPVDVGITVNWPQEPTDVAKMDINTTLISAMSGLPQINGQCSVDLIYQQSDPTVFPGQTYTNPSASLIDPTRIRMGTMQISTIPSEIATEDDGTGGALVLPQLSLALRDRVSLVSVGSSGPPYLLEFKGLLPTSSLDLLNVMSARERDEMLKLSSDATWQNAVKNLYSVANSLITISNSATMPSDMLALTTGFSKCARADGCFVTIAFQNAAPPCANGDPVSLEVIKVAPVLDPGHVVPITPPCPFDETLTLRMSGDFAGQTDKYQFEWMSTPATGTPPLPPCDDPPSRPCDNSLWQSVTTVPPTGNGAVDLTISGPGRRTLSDNYYVARYEYTGTDLPLHGVKSAWTDPQLAEGWIKRVVGDIDGFKQRPGNGLMGGGIAGAESTFASYGTQGVNTIVSMVSQAGPRWEGDVPLNCKNLDAFGLLQIYETVYNRAMAFSVDGQPPVVDYDPVNKALLLIASRIADLYTLLANEAYADAADPTIGFGTDDHTYGDEASSLHCFDNVTSSLLEEELALLRGRDASVAPNPLSKLSAPFYNRLVWNFTSGGVSGGEVAYALNYNLQPDHGDVSGEISEADAQRLYPQGHGDAWGHYLTALKHYYRLLRHPNYTWVPRPEGVLVGATEVTVNYFDERKFAAAAAAKARTGAEVVNLTYRQKYVEDPKGQWQGYKDTDPNRAWGFAEWGERAGQGAYFDWVVGNAILPAQDSDPTHTGIQKVDRTTVPDLREVAGQFAAIQAQVDTGDTGFNPLGVAGDVIPFDIDPTQIDMGMTHFEQIYGRAVTAMNNAIAVFNHANSSTQLLRRQADSLNDFQKTIDDQEVDYKNRLIEIYGYPYPDDIGPGKSFPQGYDGPDLIHYDYVDVSALTGDPSVTATNVTVTLTGLDQVADGLLDPAPLPAIFTIATSADGSKLGEVKPSTWTSERRAPGEIQQARSDLLQAWGHFKRALADYDSLLSNIEGQAGQVEAQYALNAAEINVLNNQLNEQKSLEEQIRESRSSQLDFSGGAKMAEQVADSVSECLPLVVGLADDVTSVARCGLKIAGGAISTVLGNEADEAMLSELDSQQALADLQAGSNITLTTLRNEFAVKQAVLQLEQSVRQEVSSRLELYTLQEAMHQAAGKYAATLAKGQRLLDDRSRFRGQTAEKIQVDRYRDMAFRIFRNDALQKYRAQFDLAARYVYLAAKAYDFETTLLSNDQKAGQDFLTNIVRERVLGSVTNGLPETGVGLADPLKRMSDNFSVLKGQLGFNNPAHGHDRFSLRSELFRVQPGSAGNAAWRQTLHDHVVANLLNLPEFQEYARIFDPHLAAEPAIVIPFDTKIDFALNFFGWPEGGGDSTYDSTNFATKVRSVGVWFSNYNGLSMSNTPNVYLFPVGDDILRSPTSPGVLREFRIFDQILPQPFPVSNANLMDPNWIPINDSLSDTFGQVRKYSSFRAYHDAGFDQTQMIFNSRLIGRSVWNTKWILIIPAGTLNSDRAEAISRFIDGLPTQGGGRDGNGVTDIKLYFDTYAYSGN